MTDQHPEGALGFLDETWGRRLARPAVHSWAEVDHPLRLVEQAVAADDSDPKALACYGRLVRRPRPVGHAEQVWLRFVDGRPLSAVTTAFLAWCCPQVEGHKACARGP